MVLDVIHSSSSDVGLPRCPRAFKFIAFPSPGTRQGPCLHHIVPSPPSLVFPPTSASSCVAKRRGARITHGT